MRNFAARPLFVSASVAGTLALTGGVLGPVSAAPRPPQVGRVSASAPAESSAAMARAPRSCSSKAAAMPLRQVVGQLFMVGVSSNGLSASTAQVLRRQQVGSVVLLGNTSSGVDRVRGVTAAARRAAGAPAGVRLLTAVDQEGGLVQRLQGPGFNRIPSARVQGGRSDASLRRDARTWGRQLRRAGVQADLAPVADVVPRGMEDVNQPIGKLHRGFGSSPTRVAAKSGAVVSGYRSVGVATAVKHFPGLGAVVGNTDHVARVVDRTTRRGDPRLAGFAAAVRHGSDAVMVSSATYTRIDSRHLALFSPVVMDMIRHDLGFHGVVVSDDVGAAVALQGVRPGDRATRFLAAGGDLVVNATPGLTPQMTTAVLARAKHDRTFAASLRAKAARVLTMKSRDGLVACRG